MPTHFLRSSTHLKFLPFQCLFFTFPMPTHFFKCSPSLFLLHKSPHKTLSPLPSQSHSQKQSSLFFFYSKNLVEHYIFIMQWLLLSFFFSFFVKKILQKAEALNAKKHFSPETDRNVPKWRSFRLAKSQKNSVVLSFQPNQS